MAEWLEPDDEWWLRIQLATAEKDVPWTLKALEELGKNVDSGKFTPQVCVQMVHDLVKTKGCRIKVRNQKDDETYGAQRWYGVTLNCDGVELFIKFLFQKHSYARITVVGAHD